MTVQDHYNSEEPEMRDPTQLCCLALASTLGSNKLAYPGNSAYEASSASYYSQQQNSIRPACILFPQTVRDVSHAVKTLSRGNSNGTCDFAIRSGGHTSWAGASNIAGGVTLDLRGLSSIVVNEDKTIVQVGTGATWDSVYEILDPLGLGVAGGRVAGVGVGGLTLGGGLSHMSPRYGWTCDTVRNFEIVLSDGEIAEANVNHNADLFFALRGGGNNFGIVTRIDLETFQLGLIWSGFSISENSILEENIKEFVRLSTAADYDEYASFMLSFAYGGSTVPILANTLTYTKAVEDPPLYKNILAYPKLMSNSGIKTYAAASLELAALVPTGSRTLYRTHTIISTEPVLRALYIIWEEALQTFNEIPGFTGSLALEPIPPVIYERYAADNALGLTGRNGTALVVALLEVRWANSSDDEFVVATCKTVMEKVEKGAQDLNAYDPFIYLNYAAPDQSPILRYGEESVARLKTVRDRVDSTRMFTDQVPGGHKLPNSNKSRAAAFPKE